MNAEPDISRIARTIGDPTRIRMLTLLMEGRALTAKELAYGAGVGPATGTAHLRKLLRTRWWPPALKDDTNTFVCLRSTLPTAWNR